MSNAPVPARHAVVVGGSIAGLAAGTALIAAGWRVTVVEKSASMDDRGAGLGVDVATVRAIGALAGRPVEPLATLKTPKRTVTFVRDGKAEGDYAEAMRGEHASWFGLSSYLRSCYSGTYLVPRTVESIQREGNGAVVALDSGEHLPADLVVLADGYNSAFRHLVDPGSRASFSGYVLWRGLLPRSSLRAHNLDVHFPADTMRLATTPRDHLVAYPIPPDPSDPDAEPRLNWGWYTAATLDDVHAWFRTANGSRTDPRSVAAASLLPSTAQHVLSLAQKTWPPPFSSLVQATVEESRLFAAGIFAHLPSRLASPPFAAVGDAAHTASPITGAGARHAIADGLALGEALSGGGLGKEV
ncbi:hypothetical protein DFJ74DRAFT_767360 [Hyaloraphidium curvatum]|nr:hypothetical protein DFJ74DRAFT_767360 [Hyaloraphidium curvatum]